MKTNTTARKPAPSTGDGVDASPAAQQPVRNSDAKKSERKANDRVSTGTFFGRPARRDSGSADASLVKSVGPLHPDISVASKLTTAKDEVLVFPAIVSIHSELKPDERQHLAEYTKSHPNAILAELPATSSVSIPRESKVGADILEAGKLTAAENDVLAFTPSVSIYSKLTVQERLHLEAYNKSNPNAPLTELPATSGASVSSNSTIQKEPPSGISVNSLSHDSRPELLAHPWRLRGKYLDKLSPRGGEIPREISMPTARTVGIDQSALMRKAAPPGTEFGDNPVRSLREVGQERTSGALPPAHYPADFERVWVALEDESTVSTLSTLVPDGWSAREDSENESDSVASQPMSDFGPIIPPASHFDEETRSSVHIEEENVSSDSESMSRRPQIPLDIVVPTPSTVRLDQSALMRMAAPLGMEAAPQSAMNAGSHSGGEPSPLPANPGRREQTIFFDETTLRRLEVPHDIFVPTPSTVRLDQSALMRMAAPLGLESSDTPSSGSRIRRDRPQPESSRPANGQGTASSRNTQTPASGVNSSDLSGVESPARGGFMSRIWRRITRARADHLGQFPRADIAPAGSQPSQPRAPRRANRS